MLVCIFRDLWDRADLQGHQVKLDLRASKACEANQENPDPQDQWVSADRWDLQVQPAKR